MRVFTNFLFLHLIHESTSLIFFDYSLDMQKKKFAYWRPKKYWLMSSFKHVRKLWARPERKRTSRIPIYHKCMVNKVQLSLLNTSSHVNAMVKKDLFRKRPRKCSWLTSLWISSIGLDGSTRGHFEIQYQEFHCNPHHQIVYLCEHFTFHLYCDNGITGFLHFFHPSIIHCFLCILSFLIIIFW